MTQTVFGSASLKVRPKAGEAVAIMFEMPVLKMLHEMGVGGRYNSENRDFLKYQNDGVCLPSFMQLPQAFMTELRGTPGMCGHAKWLKVHLEPLLTKKIRQSRFLHA